MDKAIASGRLFTFLPPSFLRGLAALGCARFSYPKGRLPWPIRENQKIPRYTTLHLALGFTGGPAAKGMTWDLTHFRTFS